MIRLLGEVDLEATADHVARLWAEPDDVRSRPYSSNVPFDRVARVERYRASWSKRLDEPGWSRTWGLVIDGTIRGHLDLKTSPLVAELHRAGLGIGLERVACDRGHGTAMMRLAIAWARTSGLAWIDLGVFSDNARAIALYKKLGFTEIGVTRDRFRLDGASIDDISMTLALT